LIDLAYAMGASGGPDGSQTLAGFIPLILIFAIFYFLLIMPQQKKAKEHKKFIDNLKKGDKVATTGGIHGKITGLTDTIVTLEIADKVRIKVSRNQIAGTSSI
jgi:preprotein translocase subunit YajC